MTKSSATLCVICFESLGFKRSAIYFFTKCHKLLEKHDEMVPLYYMHGDVKSSNPLVMKGLTLLES